MKHFLFLICISFVLFRVANVYSSEVFDIATMKCSDPSTKEEDKAFILWLDGYLSGIAGKTKSSEREIEELGVFIEADCKKDPNQTILSIINKL